MKHIAKRLTLIVSALQSTNGRMVIVILSLALFVLAAGAPNATIGIGK
jgi:hypothetical protein